MVKCVILASEGCHNEVATNWMFKKEKLFVFTVLESKSEIKVLSGPNSL